MLNVHFNCPYPGFFYMLFYSLAFLVAAIWQMYEGKKRKFSLFPWIVFVIVSKIIFISGTKLVTFSIADWQQFFQTFSFPDTHQRSLIGGLFAFGLVYLLARFVFRYSNSFLDTLVFPMLAAMAIQRLGCFCAGCCYGTPSEMPWSVAFGEHAQAFKAHLYHHQIPDNALHSMSVHPVQLYQSLASLIGIVLAIMFKRKLHASGNLFIAALAYVLLTRFMFEFLIDPLADVVGNTLIFHLKMVQWLLLPVIIGLIVVVFYREKMNVQTASNKTTISNIYIYSLLILTFGLFTIGKNWFSTIEFIAVFVIFGALFVGLTIKWFRNIESPTRRYVPIGLSLAAFILMSQQVDTSSISKKIPDYFTLDFSAMAGQFEDSEGLCAKTYDKQTVLASAGFSKFHFISNNRFDYNILNVSAIGGSTNYRYTYDGERFVSPYYSEHYSKDTLETLPFFCLKVSYLINRKWFGIGIGSYMGSVTSFSEPKYNQFIPSFYSRLGQEKYLYISGSFFENYPLASFHPSSTLKIGSNFGLTNGLNLETGLVFIGQFSGGWMFSGSIDFFKNYRIKPLVIIDDYNKPIIMTSFQILNLKFNRK